MSQKEVYNIICGYCDTLYNFRVYQDKKQLQPGYRPDPDKDKMFYSHGVCEKCYPEVKKQMYADLEKIIS